MQLLRKKLSMLSLSSALLLLLVGSTASVSAQSPAHNFQQAGFGRGHRAPDCCPPNSPQYQDYQTNPYAADNLGPAETEIQGANGASVAPFGDEDLFTSNDTVATSPTSIAPNMIGDFFASSLYFSTPGGNAVVPIAAGDRRFKMADSNNPLPQDRILFNYHLFNNSLQGFGDGNVFDVNRYTLGVEKTFWDGMASFEIRVPFASGLDATQTINTNTQGVEFGNITGVLKMLMFQTENMVVSGGLAVVLPTAKDAILLDSIGTQLARVDNEAVFLQPFVGASFLNDEGLFFTFFGQLDFDVTGLGVDDSTTASSGQLYSQTLMMLDGSLGKWVYRDPYSPGYITGIAPVMELHYTSTLNNADSVGSFGNPFNRVDNLNLLGGIHFLFGQRTMLTVTAGAPLRTGDAADKAYDSEFGVRFNRYF